MVNVHIQRRHVQTGHVFSSTDLWWSLNAPLSHWHTVYFRGEGSTRNITCIRLLRHRPLAIPFLHYDSRYHPDKAGQAVNYQHAVYLA